MEKIEVTSPPITWLEDSAAIYWNRPADIENIMKYHIFLNDVLWDEVYVTDYTFYGLKPGTAYEIYVVIYMRNGKSYESNHLSGVTKEKATRVNIIDFGAVGDGISNNTKAIQRAIDASKKGDMIYIPEGTFVSGALYLESDRTLYLENNAKLIGSNELMDFPIMEYRFEGIETECYASLINNKIAEPGNQNIVIMGQGTIDANGSLLRQKQLAEKAGKPGRAVCIRNTKGVYVRDVTIRQSPAWCLHTIYCKQVILNQVKIYTKFDEKGKRYKGISNGDGFDPDSCSDVIVFHSFIQSQDDCIAIKAGRDEEGRKVGIPSENIRISNCQFEGGFGVAVGSEMAAGIRNVLVQDCTFHNVYSVASIKAPRGRGGIIENITYDTIKHSNHSNEECDCEWYRGALYIDQFYSHKTFDDETPREITTGTPYIKNITLKNIQSETVAGNAIYFNGLPEAPIRNIRLENVRVKGLQGMFVNNTKGLELVHVFIETYM